MLQMLQKKTPKTPDLFECNFCDFKCSKKSDYARHLMTPKHQNATEMLHNATYFTPKNAEIFVCDKCCKNFKHSSSLYRHKKNCPIIENSENNQNIEQNIDKKDELINYLIKENQEFKSLILEIVKKDTITNNNNNINNNSHNKTFNLNFFLNETCKDAMNIMDFVDSLKLQLSDLENLGKLGYVDGISKIIVQNLKSLDETKRPVHCTDSKREVMYVKDDNKWEKENENKQKMRKVIKHVTHKNSKLLKEFKSKYPGCEKSDSKYSDKYDKLIIEAMGGKGDNDLEKEDKIIRNIAKVVIIDKTLDKTID
jgi:hypothetical protein